MIYYQQQRFPNGVKYLIFINVLVFILQNLVELIPGIPYSMETLFALDYGSVVYGYQYWQIFTYMFLHANWWHLLFNMLALYFIGSDVEREWGTRSFVQYYLASGTGAGVVIFLTDAAKVLINPNSLSINFNGYSFMGITLGASGAIFALILAFSILFRERQITLLLFFILPVTIRGKNLLVISLILTVFLPMLMGGGVRISHSGHIGGVISGLIFLFLFRKNPYFVHAYYSLTQWWGGFRNAFKKTKNNREFFNSDSTFRYPPFKGKNSQLDETQMTEREIENKIDQLLDIISDKGLSGLSENEKKFLHRVSTLYQHKFPH